MPTEEELLTAIDTDPDDDAPDWRMRIGWPPTATRSGRSSFASN